MLFIITGGTIDKQLVLKEDGVRFDHNSKVFEQSYVPKILSTARFNPEYETEQPFMIDSLDMTDSHRSEIVDAILRHPDEIRIVVTHGTDFMVQTAQYLQKESRLRDKTIVLTGAMEPLCMQDESDASFNLGMAVAYANSSKSGVYIAMSGQLFTPDNVYKDKANSIFRINE